MDKSRQPNIPATRKPVVVNRVNTITKQPTISKAPLTKKNEVPKIKVYRRSISTNANPGSTQSNFIPSSGARSLEDLEQLRRSLSELEQDNQAKEKEFKDAVEKNLSIQILANRYNKDETDLLKSYGEVGGQNDVLRRQTDEKMAEMAKMGSLERDLKKVKDELANRRRDIDTFAAREQRINRGMSDYMEGFRGHMATMSALMPILVLDASNGRVNPSEHGIQSNLGGRSTSNPPGRAVGIRILFHGRDTSE